MQFLIMFDRSEVMFIFIVNCYYCSYFAKGVCSVSSPEKLALKNRRYFFSSFRKIAVLHKKKIEFITESSI